MEAHGTEQKLGWARQHFWREEEIEDWGAEYRFSMSEPGKIDLLWCPLAVEEGPCCRLWGGLSILATREGRRPGAPSLHQSGGWGAAPRRQLPAPRLRGGCREEVEGLRVWDLPAGSSDVGGVTQVAAGRGEAEAQRYGAEDAVGCWRSRWGGSLSTLGPDVS